MADTKKNIFLRDKSLVVFYILYFSWLLIITFLSSYNFYNNIFSLAVVSFYFIFLKEKWDELFFLGSIVALYYINKPLFDPIINLFTVSERLDLAYPYWIILIWSTTIIALKKLFPLILKHDIDV